MSNASKPVPCNIVTEGEHASHLDHAMTPYQRRYALATIREGGATLKVGEYGPGFYICQVTLPADLGTVPCALRGPVMGDPPIQDSDTFQGVRVFGGKARPNASRMTALPALPSDTLTAIVIGGNLATLYGGPLAPQEPTDPYLAPEARPAAESFWAEHALSAESFTLQRQD